MKKINSKDTILLLLAFILLVAFTVLYYGFNIAEIPLFYAFGFFFSIVLILIFLPLLVIPYFSKMKSKEGTFYKRYILLTKLCLGYYFIGGFIVLFSYPADDLKSFVAICFAMTFLFLIRLMGSMGSEDTKAIKNVIIGMLVGMMILNYYNFSLLGSVRLKSVSLEGELLLAVISVSIIDLVLIDSKKLPNALKKTKKRILGLMPEILRREL